MTLYVCWGTWTAGEHFCGIAHDALTRAGYEPEVVRSYGSRRLPRIPFNLTRGRREVRRLTGSVSVPTLLLDDGTVVDGTDSIVAWAEAHPAQ